MSLLEDIVFAYRNKNYGAYQLRKKYPKYLFVSVVAAVILFVISALIPFWMLNRPKKKTAENVYITEYYVQPVKKNNPEPHNDLPPELKKIRKEAKFVIPQIVVNIEEEISSDFITEAVQGDTLGGGNSATGSPNGVLEGSGNSDDAVYTYVEEPPSFPGGEAARINFLKNNIKYPSIALQNKIQGKVYISFIVEKDGSLSNIMVLQGIGGGCDEEALRVTYLMPKWKPGRTQGKPVRVVINMPVNFVLQMTNQ